MDITYPIRYTYGPPLPTPDTSKAPLSTKHHTRHRYILRISVPVSGSAYYATNGWRPGQDNAKRMTWHQAVKLIVQLPVRQPVQIIRVKRV